MMVLGIGQWDGARAPSSGGRGCCESTQFATWRCSHCRATVPLPHPAPSIQAKESAQKRAETNRTQVEEDEEVDDDERTLLRRVADPPSLLGAAGW